MQTIHYLNWDREERGPATELFSKLHHHENPEQLINQETFNNHYRKIAQVENKDPEKVWQEWNRGSQQESQKFQELRYCTNCDTYIEGGEEATTHAYQNHGYGPELDKAEPDYIRAERSMSVGDILEKETGQLLIAASIGFEEIHL